MKMRTSNFNVYADPGHAWLKVSKVNLLKMGIAFAISNSSYMRGGYAYLEEDCDATLFIRTLREMGLEPKFKYHYTDKRSKIRSYSYYRM